MRGRHRYARDWPRTPGDAWSALLSATTCQLRLHSRRKVRKYDSGSCPLLCRHCRRVVGHW